MATHYDLSGDLTQSDLIWLIGWPLAGCGDTGRAQGMTGPAAADRA